MIFYALKKKIFVKFGYKQKFMQRKREVLPPTAPLLCDHIT